MSKQEIEWAKQHDWFIKEINAGVIVKDSYMIAGTSMMRDVISRFNDFEELKLWAGY